MSGGPFSLQVGDTPNPTFADTNLSAGTTYYYKVQATNALGSGPLSPAAFATTTGGGGQTTITLNPVADAHFESFNPTTAFGTSTNLRSQGNFSGSYTHAIISFDLSPVQGKTVQSATLTVTEQVIAGINGTVVAFQAATYTYNEILSTFDDVSVDPATDYEGPIATSPNIDDGVMTSYAIDVTAVVQYYADNLATVTGIASYTNSSGHQVFWGSREHTPAPPELEVIFQ